MKTQDTYKTLQKASEVVLHKDKKSKFYGYAFPIPNEEAVKPILESLRKQYPTANHVCYAWELGLEAPNYRANDDGEPNNSAGMPIYGQIQSFGLTRILVAVVRIFGGTKLGVGGLIQAYRTAAQMALENSQIVERTITAHFDLRFDYADMNAVMRLIKQHQLQLIHQQLDNSCTIQIAVPLSEAQLVPEIFAPLHQVTVQSKS